MIENKEGTKDDTNKTRWDLMPFEQLEQVADILTFGAKKYAPDNWKKVPNGRARYISALLRHVVAYIKGQKVDKESGKSHLAHAICNCLFLMWFDDEEKIKEDNIF